MPSMFDELPAPVRPTLTADQKYARHRRFALVLNWFVLGYSVLHKLLLPLYVTIAHSASFAVVDWWWLYHAAVAALLLRKSWDDAVLRAAAFFGAGGAVCQIVVSLRERTWHSVSLWVTSAATLWVVSTLLKGSRWRYPESWKGARLAFRTAALGVGFLVQFALFGFTLTFEQAAGALRTASPVVETHPVLEDPGACGVMGFRLPSAEGAVRLPELGALSDVSVEDCGFPAALARFDPERPLVVRNRTSEYLNVKAYIPGAGGRWRPVQNMPLRSGFVHTVPPESLAGHSVILLTSDADPKKGLLLLVSDPSALNGILPSVGSYLQIGREGLSSANP